MLDPNKDVAYFNQLSHQLFPDLLGIKITQVAQALMVATMPIRLDLFAPNGFLHAGSIVSFADTIAGYATIAHLPPKADSFTTLELKCNFLRAARTGVLVCEGTAEHLGRTTQVWRVVIKNQATGKTVAVFSCTQLVLYK